MNNLSPFIGKKYVLETRYSHDSDIPSKLTLVTVKNITNHSNPRIQLEEVKTEFSLQGYAVSGGRLGGRKLLRELRPGEESTIDAHNQLRRAKIEQRASEQQERRAAEIRLALETNSKFADGLGRSFLRSGETCMGTLYTLEYVRYNGRKGVATFIVKEDTVYSPEEHAEINVLRAHVSGYEEGGSLGYSAGSVEGRDLAELTRNIILRLWG